MGGTWLAIKKNMTFYRVHLFLIAIYASTGLTTVVPISAQAAASPICGEKLTRLTDIQISSLERVSAQEGHRIEVLTRTKGGRIQTVALLGETHQKSEEAEAAVNEALKHFKFRGIENANMRGTWGGYVLEKTVEGLYAFLAKADPKKYSQTSSLDQVGFEEIIDGIANALITKDVPIEEVRELKIERNGVPISSDILVNRIEKLKNSPESKLVNVDLELDHKPKLAENLQSLQIPATVIGTCVGICTGVASFFIDNSVLHNVAFASAAFGFGNTFYISMSEKLNKYQHSKWHKVVFWLARGVVEGRNATMAQNIQKALDQYPDETSLLLIVGAGHVEGIKHLLLQDPQFSSAK